METFFGLVLSSTCATLLERFCGGRTRWKLFSEEYHHDDWAAQIYGYVHHRLGETSASRTSSYFGMSVSRLPCLACRSSFSPTTLSGLSVIQAQGARDG